MLLLLCAMCSLVCRGGDVTADAVYPYAYNLRYVLQSFDIGKPDAGVHASQFALFDIDHDGLSELLLRSADGRWGKLYSCPDGRIDTLFTECEGNHLEVREGHLALTTTQGGETVTRFYEVKDSRLRELRVQKVSGNGQRSYREAGTGSLAKMQMVQKVLRDFNLAPVMNFAALDWQPVSRLGEFINVDGMDVTLSSHPAIIDAKPSENRFTAQREALALPPESYTTLAFKRMSGKAHIVEESATAVTYALDSVALPSTMFRGYAAGEAFPLLVPDGFVATHPLLQFTRWKSPEAVRPMEAARQKAVEQWYGGRKVVQSRWVASVEERKRTFYAVQLSPRDGYALGALVCFTDGAVASVAEFPAKADDGKKWLWHKADEGNFMNALPEIQVMTETDEGFEIYLVMRTAEGIKASILREFGTIFIKIL